MKNPYLIARQLLAFLKDELQEGERDEVARMIAGERELTGLVEELKDKEKIRRELERIASFDTEKALRKITRQNGMLVGRRLYRGWKIAAGIVILIGVSATCWLWSGRLQKDKEYMAAEQSLGTGVVTWKNSSGEVYALDTLSATVKNNQEKILVTNSDGLLKIQDAGDRKSPAAVGQNVIQVPCGGTYIIQLEDDTRVYLNSGSTIEFPSKFSAGERRVKLQGEAYFEVTQEQGRPFYVESELLTVKVLGTVFDVKVYEEDTRVYTTLVSGSVEVTDRQGEKRKIVPGEQFSLDTKTGQSTVTTVDVEIATAWKEGIFYFKDEPLEEIMKILARWYNLDIFYAGEQMKQTVYSGKMKMYVSVEDILRKFEKSGDLHFELKGKALTVYGK